jgi:anti-sigma regulatory factor (Ser/Thr protein kinase)
MVWPGPGTAGIGIITGDNDMGEPDRLAALYRYRILDTKPEQAFDDLTVLASYICETPIALISLIDTDRQWFKSRVGMSEAETSRSISFCSHAIELTGLYIVPDARRDEKFRDNPLVTGGPMIRFYAGAPLVTPEGHALGTLCVVDRVPRTLTPGQLEALDALRRQAQAQLELRVNLMELEEALARREKAEADQGRLIGELQSSLNGLSKLGALLPYCSVCELNLVIPADPRAIPTVTDGVKQILEGKGWAEQEIMSVELALQEALANGIRHGCKGDPTRKVQCCVAVDQAGAVTVVVRDPGTGFDASAVPNPLDPDNMLKPGGRGVFLINRLMDDVSFTEGGRTVHMHKRRSTDVRR